MSCLTANQLSEYVEGVLPAVERDKVEEELASCDECRALLCDWAQTTLHSVSEYTQAEWGEPNEVGEIHRKGDRLEQYELIDYLGAGGMGMVFSARDPALERVVAIKVVHPQYVASEQAAEALLEEARAMAAVQHPNVVSVYAAGRADDVAFIAMEKITGSALPAWLKEVRTDADRHALFCDVAKGLSAIHQAGFVHRDVKPSNVLVEVSGLAKLSDFGLASRGSDSRPVGTPAYMAPELVTGGEATSASDQYSFFQVINNSWSKPPRAIATIVERGLATNPSERWSDMNEVVQALESASRPPGQRLKLISLVVLAISALGISIWLATSDDSTDPRSACNATKLGLPTLWSDKDRDAVRNAFEKSARPWAITAFDRVNRALVAAELSWRSARVQHCIDNIERGAAAKAQSHHRACLDRRADTLTATAEYLAHADTKTVDASATIAASLANPILCNANSNERFEANPVAKEIAAAALLNQSGLYAQAFVKLSEIKAATLAINEPLLSAQMYRELGTSARRRQRYREAQTALKLAAREAAVGADPALLAGIHRDLALITGYYLSQFEAGEVHFETASNWARKIDNKDIDAKLSDVRGLLSASKGDVESALTAYDRALAIRSEHGKPLGRAESLYFRGLLGQQVPFDQARLDDLLESLAIRRRELGDDHPDVFRLYGAIGILESKRDGGAGAKEWLEKAKAEIERSLGPDSPEMGVALNALGSHQIRQGDYAGAQKNLERALKIRRKVLLPDDIDLQRTLGNLASLSYYRGEYEDATTFYQQALSGAARALGSDHPDVGTLSRGLGLATQASGKFDLARRHLTRSLEIARTTGQSSEVANAISTLAMLEANLENWDAAYQLQSEALALQEGSLSKDHPNLAYAFSLLAEIDLETVNLPRAHKHATRAVELRRKGEVAPQLLAESEFVLAKIKWRLGEKRNARALAARAVNNLGTARPALLKSIKNWQRSPDSE